MTSVNKVSHLVGTIFITTGIVLIANGTLTLARVSASVTIPILATALLT